MKLFKISIYVLGAAFLFLATSCKKETFKTVEKVNTIALAVNTAANAATTYKLQETIDLAGGALALGSCIQEELVIKSGVLKIMTVVMQNSHAYSITAHVNSSNFKLFDPLTGIEYTGSQESIFHQSYPTFNPVLAQTTTLSIVLTAPGYGDNILIKGDWHITIDATGKVSSSVDNFRADCS